MKKKKKMKCEVLRLLLHSAFLSCSSFPQDVLLLHVCSHSHVLLLKPAMMLLKILG